MASSTEDIDIFVDSLRESIFNDLTYRGALSNDTITLWTAVGYKQKKIGKGICKVMTPEAALDHLRSISSAYEYIGRVEQRLDLPITGSLKRLVKNFRDEKYTVGCLKWRTAKVCWMDCIRYRDLDVFSSILSTRAKTGVPNGSEIVASIQLAIEVDFLDAVKGLIPLLIDPMSVICRLGRLAIETCRPLILEHMLLFIAEHRLGSYEQLATLYITAIDLEQFDRVGMISSYAPDYFQLMSRVGAQAGRLGNRGVFEFVFNEHGAFRDACFFEGVPMAAQSHRLELLAYLLPFVPSPGIIATAIQNALTGGSNLDHLTTPAIDCIKLLFSALSACPNSDQHVSQKIIDDTIIYETKSVKRIVNDKARSLFESKNTELVGFLVPHVTMRTLSEAFWTTSKYRNTEKFDIIIERCPDIIAISVGMWYKSLTNNEHRYNPWRRIEGIALRTGAASKSNEDLAEWAERLELVDLRQYILNR